MSDLNLQDRFKIATEVGQKKVAKREFEIIKIIKKDYYNDLILCRSVLGGYKETFLRMDLQQGTLENLKSRERKMNKADDVILKKYIEEGYTLNEVNQLPEFKNKMSVDIHYRLLGGKVKKQDKGFKPVKIGRYDSAMNLLEIYDSIIDAEVKFGMGHNLSRHLDGNMFRGYYWRRII